MICVCPIPRFPEYACANMAVTSVAMTPDVADDDAQHRRKVWPVNLFSGQERPCRRKLSRMLRRNTVRFVRSIATAIQ